MTWVYAIRDIDRGKLDDTVIQLNGMGDEGWELVAVTKLAGSNDRYFFKRGSTDDAPPSIVDKVSDLIGGLFPKSGTAPRAT